VPASQQGGFGISAGVSALDQQGVGYTAGGIDIGGADHGATPQLRFSFGVVEQSPGQMRQQQGTAIKIPQLSGATDEALHRREGNGCVGGGAGAMRHGRRRERLHC
jgi:hypothetical protein